MACELFLGCINLIANLTINTEMQALVSILQRTPLIEMMTRAVSQKHCTGKMLGSLTFLASALCFH